MLVICFPHNNILLHMCTSFHESLSWSMWKDHEVSVCTKHKKHTYICIYIYTVHIYICIRCISWCVFSKCGLFVGRSCRLAFCAQRNLYTQLIYLHRIEVCNVLSSWWCLKQSSAFGVRVSTNTKFSISDENNLTSIINVFPENNRENDLRCLWL